MSFPSVVNNSHIDILGNLSNTLLKDSYASFPEHTNRFASPIFANNFKYMPPILIQVGERELLYDECTALAVKLAKDCNFVTYEVYNDHVHAFPVFHLLSFSASIIAFKRASEFILNHIGQFDTSPKATRVVYCHEGINVVSSSVIQVCHDNAQKLKSYSFRTEGSAKVSQDSRSEIF
jgi:hypothetical protein